ncbi:beta-ketoacyl-ACP synthase III [Thermocaproicibacter melissae]|jgi:3-oxoacyl-[acyl-carrier-protein] synthase III|uniref:beta-ketoacyl-ACP synthase III n=1 Tax=Thermocaproicibacter melissae TaxID=2966552 RepID=UPI0024B0CED1|nr:beta-ketoacyl-ACP synthase III [Thermocaproicibacter melissae]WBY64665.1 ketoacyl-ACP synthase III [Thermocaproicibacter melissae]
MSFTITGTGSCLPAFTVQNDDFTKFVDTSDEWITTRTGIRRRHFIKDETLSQIAVEASQKALENAGLAAADMDLILCATLQGEDVSPSLACLVQAELGANCPAFDLNAGCSGFLYALHSAAAYFRAGMANHILIVCAEQLSRFLDWKDRSTCVLFGDGAGAVVLSRGDSLLTVRTGARGQRENLQVPGRNVSGPFWHDTEKSRSLLSMNGREIFKFAVTTVQNEIESAVKDAGLTADDVDYFLLHQANGRIIDSARTRLHQPEEKFPGNYEECGNTSAASIPLLLDELNRNHRLKKGDILLLCAFGAGLTWGSCIIRWEKN